LLIQYTMDQLWLPMDLEQEIPPRHVALAAEETR